MPNPPQFVFEYPVDGQTELTASYYVTLQQNVVNYVAQFMPLVGGSMLGPIVWASQQTFPGNAVTVTDPAYAHNGIWQYLSDHIADASVHQQHPTPGAHATTHEIGGSDPVFGNLLPIDATNPTTSIKSYIDSLPGGGGTGSVAPSTRYEIGGADPLYGNLIAINSQNPSEDIATYVNNAVTSAALGNISGSPVFASVTVSSGLYNTGGNLTLQSNSTAVFVSDGTNLQVSTPGTAGVINFGNQTSANSYGSISNAGYVVQNSVYGPNNMKVNGGGSFTGDITISRTSQGLNNVGVINIGSAGGTLISWNSDVAGQFYISKAATVNGQLTANGNLVVAGPLSLGAAGQDTSKGPTIRSDGSSLILNAKNGGSLYLGWDDLTLSSIFLGPQSATWGSIDANGLHVGQSVFGPTSIVANGSIAANGATVSQAGDIGAARTAGSGQYYFGQAQGASLDYGVTSPSSFSFSTVTAGLALQISQNGTISIGQSRFGASTTLVSGTLDVSGAVALAGGVLPTQPGVNLGGASDKRLYAGDSDGLLRWYTDTRATSHRFAIYNSLSNIETVQLDANGYITCTGSINAAGASISGVMSVSGILSANGGISVGGAAIQYGRAKLLIGLGFQAGPVATNNTYPAAQVPRYSGAYIERFLLTAQSADNGATVFTFYKNGQVIGTAGFGNGATTSIAIPITNPLPIAAGDILTVACTSAGIAQGVSIELEGYQSLY